MIPIILDPNFNYDLHEFHKMCNKIDQLSSFSLIHTNISSLAANGEELEHLTSNLDYRQKN